MVMQACNPSTQKETELGRKEVDEEIEKEKEEEEGGGG